MHDSRGIRRDFEENYSASKLGGDPPPLGPRTPGVIISPPQASVGQSRGGKGGPSIPVFIHWSMKREISLGTTA